MIKKLFFLLLFGVSAIIFFQKITLTGTVKDSLQNPLSYANVLAKPKEVSKNSQFEKSQHFISNSIHKLLKCNNHKKVHKK